MSLRTKIVVWFLLLSVLPLAAIVSYSYVSSGKALRKAVLAESWEIAGGLSDQMESTRAELGERVRSLHGLPWKDVLAASQGDGSGGLDGHYEAMLRELAPFVDTLEFIPSAPSAPEAPAEAGTEVAATSEVSVLAEGLDLEPVLIELETLLSVSPERLAEAWRTDDILEERVQEDMAVAGLDAAAEAFDAARAAFENSDLSEADRIRLKKAGKEFSRIQAMAFRKMSGVKAEELEQMARRQEKADKLIGQQYDCPVEVGGEEVGRLRASVVANRVVAEVLSRTDRSQGEIPFALDTEGQVYLAKIEDKGALEAAGLLEDGRMVSDSTATNWVVARIEDEESDLIFGIARPIRDSVRELRATAGRNLGVGFGLVGLALIGVVPLSRRITRDLEELTVGSEHIAAGNWDVRVPVRSRDEVGQLARSFNRMARELTENQKHLVETQLQQQLLAAENARKGNELEEAREFQLSLLPKELPQRAGIEVAVFMRTATEVGGDYYDFKVEDDGALLAVIGDATGHGAKAGTMVTVIKSLFTAWWGGEKLAEFLVAAAGAIRSMSLGRMAMALQLARIEGGSLKLSSAGMPPLLICRGDGRVEEVAISGLPLGGMARCHYDEREVDLQPGDVILLMSDGFPELPNEAGEPIGYERVRELFEATCGQEPQEIIDGLATFADTWHPGSAPSDDITFVVMRMAAA